MTNFHFLPLHWSTSSLCAFVCRRESRKGRRCISITFQIFVIWTFKSYSHRELVLTPALKRYEWGNWNPMYSFQAPTLASTRESTLTLGVNGSLTSGGSIYIVKYWTPPIGPIGPIFFIFMQFSQQFGQIIGWRTWPFRVGAPSEKS